MDATAAALIASSLVTAGAFGAGFVLGRGVLGRDVLEAANVADQAEDEARKAAEEAGQRIQETSAALEAGAETLATLIESRRDRP
tara:strand:- start:513 stop:767 length:255 start_codon:yes stop_codon:yes gene_type:complete